MKTKITLICFVFSAILFSESTAAQDNSLDTIIVKVKMPNGQLARLDTLVEGEGYPLSGFPFPMQYLNGGYLLFPAELICRMATM